MSVVIVGTLAEQEQIIERGLHSFVEVGNALMKIRDEEMYRDAGFDGFVAYLESKSWGIRPAEAYNQINTARVSNALETNVGVRQARELAPLLKRATPEVVQQVYAEVIEETGGKPTARAIREKVASVLPKKRPTKPKNHSVHAETIQDVESLRRRSERWTPELIDRLPQTVCRKEHAKIQEVQKFLARMSEAYAPRLESLPVVPRGVRSP